MTNQKMKKCVALHTASSLMVRVAVPVVKLLKVVREIITSISKERGDPDIQK
jgi:hypothetical protein